MTLHQSHSSKKVGNSPKQYGEDSLWGADGLTFVNQLPIGLFMGDLSEEEADKAINQMAVAMVIEQIKERQHQNNPMCWCEFGLPEFRQMLVESEQFAPYQNFDDIIQLKHTK